MQLIVVLILFLVLSCEGNKRVEDFQVNPLETVATMHKKCPAAEHCKELKKLEDNCRNAKKEIDCKKFVETFRLLISRSDCQRAFDTRPVPAIWLCDYKSSEFPTIHEKACETLSSLQFDFAKELYHSEEFRSTLDGELAEIHMEKSKSDR